MDKYNTAADSSPVEWKTKVPYLAALGCSKTIAFNARELDYCLQYTESEERGQVILRSLY